MKWMKFKWVGTRVFALGLATGQLLAQGTLVVDQASGTLDEVLIQSSTIPDNQLAQSFTPSFSAVGWVQLSAFVTPTTSGELLAINLRQGAFNGPIVGSTAPVLFVPGPDQKATFYFPDNIPVTAGQLYFFELALQSAGPMFIDDKFPSSYLGGDLWSNGGKDSTVDLWFREGIVVPEPGTVALLLVGGGALLGRRLLQT